MIKFSKLNSQGFMLAEVVITSSVIAATLVTSFIALNKLKSSYERRDRYYDLDAEQIAIESKDKDEAAITNLVTSFNSVSGYNVNVYTVNQISDLETALAEIGDPNYIDYLKNNIDYSETYSKIIVVEVKKNDNKYYYYALKVKE